MPAPIGNERDVMYVLLFVNKTRMVFETEKENSIFPLFSCMS
jgi:hypothetical protein